MIIIFWKVRNVNFELNVKEIIAQLVNRKIARRAPRSEKVMCQFEMRIIDRGTRQNKKRHKRQRSKKT